MTTDKVKAKIQELVPDVMKTLWKGGRSKVEPDTKCGFGCGRIWSEVGDFEDCSSMYHVAQKCPECVRVHKIINSGCTGIICTSGCACVLPITLAIVLRAIKKMPDREWQKYSQIINKWNLEHDNYDDQDRPTQLFIGSLLGVMA